MEGLTARWAWRFVATDGRNLGRAPLPWGVGGNLSSRLACLPGPELLLLPPPPGSTSCPHSGATWLALCWVWAEQECPLERPSPALATLPHWLSVSRSWKPSLADRVTAPAMQSRHHQPSGFGAFLAHQHSGSPWNKVNRENIARISLQTATPPTPVLWLHTLSAAICVNNLLFPASLYSPCSPTPMLLGSLQW